MKNNNFCKIAQDLMPNYIENLLSDESKTFVEEHIENCAECSNYFNKMNTNISNNNKNTDEKLNIDYLKKYRKKMSIFKICLYLILILIIITCTVLFSKYKYNENIINKVTISKNMLNNSNNFYICKKTIDIEYKSKSPFQTEYKIYYKDGKYKTIDHTTTTYGQIDSTDCTKIYDDLKQIDNITYTVVPKYKNELLWVIPSYEPKIENNQKMYTYTFILSIRNEKYNNKDCYVITTGKSSTGYNEDWIDKETGLIVRQIQKSEGTYYREYIYTIIFDNVIDEDVTLNNLEQYSDYAIHNISIDNDSISKLRK